MVNRDEVWWSGFRYKADSIQGRLNSLAINIDTCLNERLIKWVGFTQDSRSKMLK